MGLIMDMMARLGGHLVEMEVLEYALDGLEGEARGRAEEHLRQCGMCRRALRQAMDMQDGLALAVAPVAPPEGIVGRMVQGVWARRVGGKSGEE